jgi:hypothetical protein
VASVSPGAHLFLGPPLFGFLRLSYQCPATLSNPGTLNVYNDSGNVAEVFVDDGGSTPTYSQLAAGGQIAQGATATGDSFHIQAAGPLGVLTIEVGTAHRSSDCHAQAQALLSG